MVVIIETMGMTTLPRPYPSLHQAKWGNHCVRLCLLTSCTKDKRGKNTTFLLCITGIIILSAIRSVCV